MFNVGHRPPDGSQARVRMDEDVGAGRCSWCGTKSWKPLSETQDSRVATYRKEGVWLWTLVLWPLLTCKRWRWSSVWESCSISHLFLSSSVISSSSSLISLSALCSAAACFLWIICTNSVSIFSMERIRAANTSRLSIISLLELFCRCRNMKHVSFTSISKKSSVP